MTVLLAWGIGSGTALLSLVDAVSFRSLEVQHPDQLVRVVQHDPASRTETAFPRAFFEALRARNEEFSAIAGELEAQAVLSEPAPAQEIRVSFVTAQFFSLLGVPALYGRVLTPSDDQDASGTEPAVLSYAFWNTRFHRDPRVLGRSILFNNHPFVIVGVMPPRSTRALEHMHNHIPGVEVDDATFARLDSLTGEDAKAAGVSVAADVISGLRKVPGVAGVHIMAPGWEVEAVTRVVAAAGLRTL